jgi:signal transduction histidine kinase
VALLHLVPVADPAVAEGRDIAERQVKLMARLLDDLLDLTRVALDKIELRKERLDLAEVVTQAVQASAPLIQARRHWLSVAPRAGPVPLEGDRARLVQVAVNLLNNAAKYTDEGGEIHVAAGREGGEAVLRVRDTGTGIAPGLLGQVFDLYKQADGVGTRAQGGLGIGLALARRLVELHGGTVTAHSEGPGRGSEFVVRLPALADEPPAAP